MPKTEEETYEEWKRSVNMSAKELDEWLATPESREVGEKEEGEESTGHASGRRIVEMLQKKKDELTASDNEHMQRVISYISRHRAQQPDKDTSRSRWRYSLKNWGHDPEKQ